MTDITQLKIAIFFTELSGCEAALRVCVDLFMMKQTPLVKRIRSALKSNKKGAALCLMEHYLSINDTEKNGG